VPLASQTLLGEHVDGRYWFGSILIVAGIVLTIRL
jgi:drug/metabolite transporter (DMT)-like permease